MTKLISVFQNSSKHQRNFSSVKSVLFFTAFLSVKTGASVSGKIQPASAEFFDSNKITLTWHKIHPMSDSHIYAPLTKNGWDKLEIEVCCSAAGRTRNSGLQGEGNVKAKQRRTEVIWRNPEAMKRIENRK